MDPRKQVLELVRVPLYVRCNYCLTTYDIAGLATLQENEYRSNHPWWPEIHNQLKNGKAIRTTCLVCNSGCFEVAPTKTVVHKYDKAPAKLDESQITALKQDIMHDVTEMLAAQKAFAEKQE